MNGFYSLTSNLFIFCLLFTGEVANVAHLYVGKETDCIKKLKKPDDALAAQTFGLMGAGIEDVLELSAMNRNDVSCECGYDQVFGIILI